MGVSSKTRLESPSYQYSKLHATKLQIQQTAFYIGYNAARLQSYIGYLGYNLREFVETHVILAPGTCGREDPSCTQ